MLYETLCEKLDPRNGEIQQIDRQDSKYWQLAFDIAWKGNLHFITVTSRRGFGHYYVERDNQLISPTYSFTKTDDALFKKMQRMIDEINSGKYRNKKTLSEKIISAAEQKGLVSYMNNTKWHELFNALNENIPKIDLQYKTIFEADPPKEYWELYGDEDIEHMNLAQIEWLKIKPIITEYTHIGALVSPKIQTYDKQEELFRIFHKYNIPYEYDENEQAFIVYGYK